MGWGLLTDQSEPSITLTDQSEPSLTLFAWAGGFRQNLQSQENIILHRGEKIEIEARETKPAHQRPVSRSRDNLGSLGASVQVM